MSWQAFAWADSLDADVVGPLAYRVLLKLANVADATGQRAWRNKADVARELGRDQRSIQRALRELEHAALILTGDQEFVHHIRADRRPKVYNLNFSYQREFSQPELDAFETIVSRGDTVIHRSPRGDTRGANGETTGVALRTFKNINNSSSKTSHSTRVGKEDDDASGGDHRPADAVVERCAHGHPIIGHSGGGTPFCEIGCAPVEVMA